MSNSNSSTHCLPTTLQVSGPELRILPTCKACATPSLATPFDIRMLVIEDDAGDAHLVERALKSCNDCFDVCHAETLVEALELIQNDAFDLVLLDLSLPDSFGLEGIERLSEHCPQTPIVVLTGLNDSKLALDALERGAQDYLVKGEWSQESLKRTVRYAIQRHEVQTENQRLMARIQRQSRDDALTGVLNRHSFTTELDREWARSTRNHSPLSCVMIDVDLFKSINDAYGHATGDEVLRVIGQRIQAECRECDLVGRYGGEEFCVVLPDIAERGAVVWAERVRQSIADHKIIVADKCLSVTASFGLAQRQPSTTQPLQCVDLADQSLLMAKRYGRNQVLSAYQIQGRIAASMAGHLNDLSAIQAHSIMATLTHPLGLTASLSEAAFFFERTALATAAIVDSQGILKGILSEDSLIRELSSTLGWNTSVEQIMNKHPNYLPLEASASDVLEMLQRNSMREVYLVSRGAVVGYVSRMHLVSYLHRLESAKPH